MDRTHLTKYAFLERAGWTATLVGRLLGEPDQRKKVFGRTMPLALYAVARIEQAEAGADFALWEVAGKTGITRAVAEIRRRVYSAIAQAYPALSAECPRQIEARQ